jgi:hypothetical protein
VADTTAITQTKTDPAQPASDTTVKDNVVPKERLDQEIAKRKERDAELDKLRAENDELKKQKATPPAKDSQTDGKGQLDSLLAQVKDIQDRNSRNELQRLLGLTEEQTQKVQEVLSQAPNFTPKEALTIARGRHADLFQGKDQRGFDPGIHGSVRPNGSGAPPPKTLKEQVGAIKTMTNPIDRDAAERRLHGEMVLSKLAASMGLKARPE